VKNCQSTEESEWRLVSSHGVPLTAEEMEPGRGGFWKKLPATHRGMTRHAGVAQSKGHIRQGPGKDNFV
jgi:hypothetical protein